MAYIVKRSSGSWEIRESRQTDKGPRSFTLATFKEETPEVLQRARDRSKVGLMESELALKLDAAGVPPAMTDVDRAARGLLDELASGGRPSEALRCAVMKTLEESRISDGEPCDEPDRIDKERQGRLFEDVLDLATELPYEPKAEIAQRPLRDLLAEARQERELKT